MTKRIKRIKVVGDIPTEWCAPFRGALMIMRRGSGGGDAVYVFYVCALV